MPSSRTAGRISAPDAAPEWRNARAKLHPGALALERPHLPIVHTVEESWSTSQPSAAS